MGKHVAVIERREVLGGVCVNTGTIPSKTMREAVLYLSGYYYQNVYGANHRSQRKDHDRGSGVARPAHHPD